MSGLLAVYDPSGKLGLTDPSPGGGSVPTAYEQPGRGWRLRDALERTTHGHFSSEGDEGEGENGLDRAIRLNYRCALVLVTEIGTPDPVGMARAREVLARRMGIHPFAGVIFSRTSEGWTLVGGSAQHWWPALPNEIAPEALARLLSEHAGCEVIHG